MPELSTQSEWFFSTNWTKRRATVWDDNDWMRQKGFWSSGSCSCFCLLWMRPVGLPVSPSLVTKKKKKICGREVGGVEPFGFNLKKKKKSQRADRVQWPSFLQAGLPVSCCHTGQREAVCWVGGQMESSCTVQLSSASVPLLASILCPHLSLSIHLFIQPSLSQSCPPFHSWKLLFYACPLFYYSN